jgi:hypothetical protein
MTDTPNLGLPYIDGSQAQKHVTHNDMLGYSAEPKKPFYFNNLLAFLRF